MLSNLSVKLRDHPLMSYRGMPNWPPVWSQGYMTEIKTLRGEIGILKHAILHERMPTRCFLTIEYEQERYTGCLVFDDSSFCRQVYDLMMFYIGSPIEEIGAIDFAHTL